VFKYDDDKEILYELAGFSMDMNARSCEYVSGSTIGESAFGDGKQSIVLYAMWKPTKFVARFSGGNEVGVSGRMPDIEVEPGQKLNLPLCQFVPRDTTQRFRYVNPPQGAEWNIPQNLPPTENLPSFKFQHWTYVGSFGNVVQVQDGGSVVVEQRLQSRPMLEFVASWKQAFAKVTFVVGEDEFCEVAIDIDENKLIYPMPPKFNGQSRLFIGWNVPEGSLLSGVGLSEPIVCGDGDEPILCNDSGFNESPIVCHDNGTLEYAIQVSALVGDIEAVSFTVTFNHMDDHGEKQSSPAIVQENQKLVPFHIGQTVTTPDGTYKFRYWKLVSGNLTSSLTVLSDCVFDAIYEKVIPYPEQETIEQMVPVQIVPILDFRKQEQDVGDCPYFKNNVCVFHGQHPRDYNWDSEPEGCPYLQMMSRIWEKKSKYDFHYGTLLEIEDVATLFKALFKANIHIADNEFYAKKWLEDETNWWYGYVVDHGIVCENPIQDQIVCEEDGSGSVVCNSSEEDDFHTYENVVKFPPDGGGDKYNNSGNVVCGEHVDVVCPSDEGETGEIICSIDG